MASILTPSAFQIKIKEEHVVKGIKTTNETFFTLGNITNVDRRIVTIPAQTPIDLFNVNGVRPSAGTFPSSSMKYARITNLDTTSSLAVSFTFIVLFPKWIRWSAYASIFATWSQVFTSSRICDDLK